MSLHENFGVSPDAINQMAQQWKTQADIINDCDCLPFANVIGPGSSTFIAVQGCAEPGQEAGSSIATRLHDMAALAQRFASDVTDVDVHIADAFNAFETR